MEELPSESRATQSAHLHDGEPLQVTDMDVGESSGTTGAGNHKTLAVLKSLISLHRVHIAVILEPRISGDAAFKMITRLGMSHSHQVETAGYSGGIWVLWTAPIHLHIIYNNCQFIHCQLSLPNGIRSYFTVVYGSPKATFRTVLWTHLHCLVDEITEPWMVIGDFNAITTGVDKSGGKPSTGCKRYRSWIDSHGTIDLDYIGSRYIWSNSLFHERLDRVFTNELWVHHFTAHRPPRRRKPIKALKLANGTWCTDQNILRNHATLFYAMLYSGDAGVDVRYGIRGQFSLLTHRQLTHLQVPITEDEVHRAFFDMDPFKAPGPAGFNARFYQHNWDTLKASICKMVSSVFDTDQIDAAMNKSVLVLLPKIPQPQAFHHLRPISLINVGTKIVTKASVDHIHLLNAILDEFCHSSSQAISKDKTIMYCSPNIDQEHALSLSSLMGIQLVGDLGKYLGVPLIHSRVSKSTYQELTSKIWKRVDL
ncbi:hypothetical protein K2173_016069 [Erythroxylum novogranatense]|uniref:Endonuclease/exonuclease/phosphatase domain-containing protein n=1 Tax=Erythroxylum novogranatense TaxID=1862640 RepID=A0AAV8SFW2_9ROSI|nr:hypothetical protein K2173_016069 [Erythroxylum novogranatense]